LCLRQTAPVADETPEAREPATHKQELAATVTGRAVVSGTATVVRGLNELRLAVLGILVGIGLAVGFGVEGRWWVQLVAGIGSFVLACFLVWWPPSRRRLMSFMHWLTGH
jgi:hypothetical protein